MPSDIVNELVAKTFAELAQPQKPQARTRISMTSNGYIFLAAWSNASLLRVLVKKFTSPLPTSHYRLKNQVDDAARSVIANIEEGFARPTTAEYLTFLGYSQASLIEVKGDMQRSRQDRILPSRPGSSLAGIGIDLGRWHEALKASVISRPVDFKGNYRNVKESRTSIAQPPLTPHHSQSIGDNKGAYRKLEEFKKESTGEVPFTNPQARLSEAPYPQSPLTSFTFLYDPVDNLLAQDLTYEMFIELVNKTDWHLRKLVVSLEDKLARDGKYYRVEQARVRSKLVNR